MRLLKPEEIGWASPPSDNDVSSDGTSRSYADQAARYGDISAPYKKRLKRGWKGFLHFAKRKGYDVKRERPAFDILDQLTVQYIVRLRRMRGTKSDARHAILAVCHNQGSWSHMPASWRALRVWQNRTPVRTRIAMPLAVLNAMTTVAVGLAISLEGWGRVLFWACAVLWQAAFEGIMRPGETVGLIRAEVVFADDLLDSSEAEQTILTVDEAKNWKHMGRKQYIILEGERVQAWLKWWCTDMRLDEKLFPGGRRDYVKCFRTVLRKLGLSDIGFVPSSFRSGGATAHFKKYLNGDRTQRAGRWANRKSMEIYLQEAIASLAQVRMSEGVKVDIRQADKFCMQTLRLPPSVPVHTLLGSKLWKRKAKFGSKR